VITQQQIQKIKTPSGVMQTHVFRPEKVGAFPAVIFYSEIFQVTAPIIRSANILAGLGFVVLIPEVFHELNPIGTALSYCDTGKDKGNKDKRTKALEQHDSDTQAMVAFIKDQAYCEGNIGTMGVCIGGHLAFRAALNPDIKAAFCLYATDIHSNTLPCIDGNDSFSRAKDIDAQLMMVFGKQDPHVPAAGREKLYRHFQALALNFQWCEVNAQHAFMRDEGERYDPALAIEMYLKAQGFFNEFLR